VLTLAQIEQLPQQQRTQQLEDSVEVNMDVQILAGLAPGSDLLGTSRASTSRAGSSCSTRVIASTPASAVSLSVSWGLAEDDPDWSQGALQAIDERLQAAAALGITVAPQPATTAPPTGERRRAHVDFPASSPHVLAVGGTMLDGQTDVTWWQSPGERTSSGGGATGAVSASYSLARVGRTSASPRSTGQHRRARDPGHRRTRRPPFYDLIFMGRRGNGGTSAATPTWRR